MKLVKYDAARAALAAAHHVDEVKDLRDKAEALAAYARQARDTDMIAWATEIKVRAERRCGEMLRETARTGERATKGKPAEMSQAATLSDLKISRTQSARYQQLAAMPDEHFETAVATAKANVGEVTTAHMLRIASEMKKSVDLSDALEAARLDAASRLRHPSMWPTLMARLAAVVEEIEAPGLIPPPPAELGKRAKEALLRITEFLMTHVRSEHE